MTLPNAMLPCKRKINSNVTSSRRKKNDQRTIQHLSLQYLHQILQWLIHPVA